jgi:hypothetical protein
MPANPDADLLALAAQCEAAAVARAKAIDSALCAALATTTDRFYALAERLARMPATTAAGKLAKARVAAKASPLPKDGID